MITKQNKTWNDHRTTKPNGIRDNDKQVSNETTLCLRTAFYPASVIVLSRFTHLAATSRSSNHAFSFTYFLLVRTTFRFKRGIHLASYWSEIYVRRVRIKPAHDQKWCCNEIKLDLDLGPSRVKGSRSSGVYKGFRPPLCGNELDSSRAFVEAMIATIPNSSSKHNIQISFNLQSSSISASLHCMVLLHKPFVITSCAAFQNRSAAYGWRVERSGNWTYIPSESKCLCDAYLLFFRYLILTRIHDGLQILGAFRDGPCPLEKWIFLSRKIF